MSINYRKFINRNEEKGNELDKAVKLASIKKGLDTEYSIFMTSYQNKVVKKPEKIRSEYNKIFFKNICKEKTIADLEKQIMMQKRLRRNGSFGSLDQFNGLKNAEFMENEYTTTVFKLEEELVENEILKNMLLKEKHKLVSSI